MGCNCCPTPQPGGCSLPSDAEIPVLLAQYTTLQIDKDPILKFLRDKIQ